jgi:hypothetical protein
MPQANAVSSAVYTDTVLFLTIGKPVYTDTVLFLTIGKPDIYQFR